MMHPRHETVSDQPIEKTNKHMHVWHTLCTLLLYFSPLLLLLSVIQCILLVYFFSSISLVIGKIAASTNVHGLIPEIHELVRLHSKGKLRLQMALRLPIIKVADYEMRLSSII